MMKPNRTPSLLRRLIVAPLGALLAVSTGLAQQVTAPPPAAPSAATREDVVRMNPFEVQASSNDVGYYAENTLAGSRLNTNIGDLASSITVVTKQQLIDTASVDMNDVFMYEANTEGANTYTPVYLNRGVMRDTIGGYSGDTGTTFGIATADRIRGLGAADTAQNNYPTIARIPFDAYNTQSVEINRGPNSLLFGMGSPAGIVNQSSTEAVLGKRTAQLEYRVGSFGSYRGSIGFNQPLGDKLAIYVAALYDSNGFERKPSYDLYRRQYVALTFKPFKNTRITANFENFDNRNNRPNYQSPIDYVTPWLKAGRPAYNPMTAMLTILDTGQVMGPYLTSTLDPRWAETGLPVGNTALNSTTSALYVPGIQFFGHNQMRIDQGTVIDHWINSPSQIALDRPAVTDLTASQWVAYADRITSSAGPTTPAGYGTWYQPAITNKSIYDWTSTNVQASNYGTMSAKTYNIELQQQIFSTPTQSLNLDLGWFRQELEEWDHYGLGQANQAVRIYVDTNLTNLDGSPNAYFGSPFVYDYQEDTFYLPETNDNLRAMLAYEKDFSHNTGWTRWLGRHRFLALWSRQKDRSNNLRYRLAYNGGDTRMLPNTATNPPNNFSWPANAASIQRDYYLGKNDHGIISHSGGFFGDPGFGGIGTTTVNLYNWSTGSWEQSGQMTMAPELFYAGGNYGITEKVLDSRNFAWQGFLWDERIIPTFGWRRDNLKIRATNLAGLTTTTEYVGGEAIPGLWNRMGDWNYLAGNTKTLGGVFKPFLGWKALDNARENGNFLARVLWGTSFHFNKSDNFNAPTTVQTDFYGNRLGKPQGTGKDWGVAFNLFDNKLVINVNWYQSDNLNAPADAAGTAIGRVVRIDTSSFRSWASDVVRIRAGQDPTDQFFGNNSVTPLTPDQQNQVATIMGVPYDWPSYNIAGTQENISKGLEASVIYNPMPNWTIKLTVGQQKSTYDKVAPELDTWLAQRLPYWQAATASDMPALVTLYNGNQLSMRNFWTGYGFNGDALIENSSTTGWTSPSAFYDLAVKPEIDVAKALQGNQVSNEREWSYSLITNYAFVHGPAKGFSIGGALRWADKAVAGYFGDPNKLSSSGLIVAPDITKPIYTPAETHIDAWIAYTTKFPKILGQNVRVRFQFNVRDLTEGGGLQAIGFNFDGSPAFYRIVDPRQYFFTTTLDF